MNFKAGKRSIVSSTIALLVAALIIITSVFSVAAVAQANATASAQENQRINKNELRLSSGDIMVTRTEDFNVTMDIIKANEITIIDGDETKTIMLARGKIADVLEMANVKLGENRISIPSADTEINGDMTVNIYDSVNAVVTADGKKKNVKLPKGNVVDSLNKLGYKVSNDDVLDVSKDSDVFENIDIVIQRVTYKEVSEKVAIDYKRVTENSQNLELGVTKLKTKGQKGEKIITKKCKYIDGKLASSKTTGTKISKKPVDEVTLVGLKGVATGGGAGTFTDMYGNTVSYSRVITGSGTAYTAPAGAGTATGVKAYHGGVAVNPNVIPYGSKLYVVSTDGSFVYGYATAVDTGGALMDGSAVVDCFYNTYEECVNFGRRNMNVYIIG